jgi:hypothetical protein
MSPEQIAALTALIGVMERMANWPFASLFLVLVIGPYVIQLISNFQVRKALERQIAMYETNVVLVKNYERLADDQKDIITLNTQAWIGVRDAIDRNEFCPVIRGRRTTHQSIQYDTDKRGGD